MIIGINITGQLQVTLRPPFYEDEELSESEQIDIFEKMRNGEYAYSISDNQIINIDNFGVMANVDIIDTESLEYEYINT
jgi:hypothetical protein